MRNGKFEINKTTSGEFFFRLKSSNGRIILQSETYKSISGVDTAISSIKINSGDLSKFEKLKSKDSKDYFVLKAGNGEIIGVSETYNSKQGMLKGIDSVQRSMLTDRIDYLYKD